MGHALHMTPEAFEALKRRNEKLLRGDKPAAPSTSSKRQPEKDAYHYEDDLHAALEARGLHGFIREFEWSLVRKFAADLAYLGDGLKVLVEIDGGAHRTKKVFLTDILKNQEALLEGWVLIRIATKQVRNGTAAEIIERILARLKRKEAM